MERAECPDCRKDVAVNQDGTLRKHTCEPDKTHQKMAPIAEHGPELVTDVVDVPQTTTGRSYCYLRSCDQKEHADGAGLCGGHWATRPDLRKVARRG